MKCLPFALVMLFVSSFLWGQTNWRAEWLRLNLTDAETSQLISLVKSTQPEIERDRAERSIVHAQLERLLLEPAPAMTDIEALVRSGADWDIKIRLLRIGRSLQVRADIGNERWALLSHLAAKVSEAEKLGKHPLVSKASDKTNTRELFLLLEDFN